ncbi:MAG: glutamate synthase (NADPH), homotetrameric [Deltaproteobacteria bacterium GWB2_55_19]|nr:MAG: glutamate synthase (NADPH), homotetrameric [Deltaproteobacteria bacterium GWB2_55_19]HAO94383.1 glutamate synthase (NADPH), homotetrameric [Deltaproteobacteria bacterium]
MDANEIKGRMKIPRQTMSEQNPHERVRNFYEVPYGFTPEQAMAEAKRCIQCKKPLCVGGCPVNIDIPWFIRLISEGKFIEAAHKLKETNGLPAVCGRVCPQEDQCEKVCVIGKKSDAVSIGRLERFAADYEREHGEITIPSIPKWTGKKAAVVGAGPAGLTVAGDLVKKGHKVTVFEALHTPGGVLMYGIPEFRLPKKIVQSEVEYLKRMGVEIILNAVVGKLETIDELLADGYGAVFVGSGAGLPNFMNIPGENLSGVYSANEYLTRVNLMKAYQFPEYDTPVIRGRKVVVIGGGNTAMDSARTALRLCPEEVSIVYRRSREELPARVEEVHHGEEEGLRFQLLTNPKKFIGDHEGRLKALECVRMELGEPDESGRRRPVEMKGSEFTIEADVAIIAIGNGANPLIPQTTPDIKVNKWGNITVNPDNGRTSKKGVFSGGDIVRGGATVILAMGDGRRAADSMDEYMRTGIW